jgi:16S rRNA (uracil1498-N3)-methyltransferase
MVRQVTRHQVMIDVETTQSPPRELGFRLEVATSLPKGDRAQFLLEKLTELGVTTYVPLITRRSTVQPRFERVAKLERYVIEASKQCGRNVLMRVAAPINWMEYCTQNDLPVCRRLAHPSGPPWEPLLGQDLAVAIGPEGGFTNDEVEAGQRAGWQPINLGARILRIETAALALAAVVALGQ